MKLIHITFSVLLLSTITSSPAMAWEDMSNEDRCAFAQVFESGTMLSVSQNKDSFDNEEVLVLVINENWSVKRGQKLLGNFRFDANDGSWMTTSPMAVNNGVAGLFGEEHIANFNTASVDGVKISINNKNLDVLDWSGFSSAYLLFDKCRHERGWLDERAAKKAEAERIAKEKRYRQLVPVDPFANPKPKPKPKRKSP